MGGGRRRRGRGAQLLEQRHPAALEGAQGAALLAERVMADDRHSVRPLEQRIEHERPLGQLHRGLGVIEREAGLGQVARRLQTPFGVHPAKLHRPLGIRLVLEHLGGRDRQRRLEPLPALRWRGTGRVAHQAVERVHVHLDPTQLGSVAACLGGDQPAGRTEPRAQQRNVALDRRRNLARQRLAPDHLRQLVLGQRAAALNEERLEQLLGLDPTEVARAQALGVDPHLDRAEQPHRNHTPHDQHLLRGSFDDVPTGST